MNITTILPIVLNLHAPNSLFFWSAGVESQLVGNECTQDGSPILQYMESFGCAICDICGDGFELTEPNGTIPGYDTYQCWEVDLVGKYSVLTDEDCNLIQGFLQASGTCGCVPASPTASPAPTPSTPLLQPIGNPSDLPPTAPPATTPNSGRPSLLHEWEIGICGWNFFHGCCIFYNIIM